MMKSQMNSCMNAESDGQICVEDNTQPRQNRDHLLTRSAFPPFAAKKKVCVCVSVLHIAIFQNHKIRFIVRLPWLSGCWQNSRARNDSRLPMQPLDQYLSQPYLPVPSEESQPHLSSPAPIPSAPNGLGL